MQNIIKTVEFLADFGLLSKGVTQTIEKNKTTAKT